MGGWVGGVTYLEVDFSVLFDVAPLNAEGEEGGFLGELAQVHWVFGGGPASGWEGGWVGGMRRFE